MRGFGNIARWIGDGGCRHGAALAACVNAARAIASGLQIATWIDLPLLWRTDGAAARDCIAVAKRWTDPAAAPISRATVGRILMTQFNDRERAFESKFAHDEEMKFRITARRNRLLVSGRPARWACRKKRP